MMDTPQGQGNRTEDSLDETLRESFPASDPGASWSGRELEDDDLNLVGEHEEPIPDPIPEADAPETVAAWEDDDAMEGPAPTG